MVRSQRGRCFGRAPILRLALRFFLPPSGFSEVSSLAAGGGAALAPIRLSANCSATIFAACSERGPNIKVFSVMISARISSISPSRARIISTSKAGSLGRSWDEAPLRNNICERPKTPAKQGFSSNFRRSFRRLRSDPKPISQAIEKHCQLRRREPQRARLNRRPDELALLKPFCRQHHSGAVESQTFQTIGPLGAKNENVATVGVGLKSLSDQRHETMDACTEVYRLRRHENADLRTKRDHRADLNATKTFVRVCASTPIGTRTVAPEIAISMRSVRSPASGRTMPSSPRCEPPIASSISTRAKVDPSAGVCLASRRQTFKRPRLTPFRRATSDTFASGMKLYTTMRAFSASLHSRRRRSPVITSTRW